MASINSIEDLAQREYKYGFVSDIDADTTPPGLSEDVIRLISAKKNEPEFMLEWRLKAYRHWAKLEKAEAEPKWAKVHYPAVDYQAIRYYSAPKSQNDGPKSLEDVDPELLETYAKLGIPLKEQERLAGVAVDAVFDSVSVATTFKGKLAEMGVIFCSFSEAVHSHPELIQKYLGSVVPYTDNFFALALLIAGIPVLHRRILNLCVFMRDQLDHRGMQLILVAHRRRAAFEVAHRRAFFSDNQRTFELAGFRRIDAKISGQFHGTTHAFGNKTERAVAEDRRVESGKKIISVRHHRAQVLLD